jgi:amino acid permease
MTLWSMIFGMFLIVVAAIGFTIYAAMEGSILAVVILSFVSFVILFAIFQGFHLVFTLMRDRQERIRMQDDLKEDMVMMQQAFKTQALQAQAQHRLMITAGDQNKLNGPSVGVGADLFSDFAEGDYE